MASFAIRKLGPACGLLLALALLLWGPLAHANDKALAEALAKQGEELAGEKKLAEACGKFAESLRLNRVAKVAYNLALCNKLRDKHATAWGQFIEALRIAKIEGDQVALANAQKQADELKPRLSYVVIRVATATAGLTVRLDEQQISNEAWGVGVPVDPGDHSVVAEAPDHQSFSAQVAGLRETETREITVPALQPVAKPSGNTPASPARVDERANPHPQGKAVDDKRRGVSASDRGAPPTRTLAWIVGGTGAALVLGGLGAGLVAKTTYDDAKAQCQDGTRACPPSAIDKEGSARTWANVSNVVTGVGAAGIITGVVLLVTGSPRRAARVSAIPSLLPLITTQDVGVTWAESF